MTTNEWLDKETDRISMELKRRKEEELQEKYNSPRFLIGILLIIFGGALLFSLPVFFFAQPSEDKGVTIVMDSQVINAAELSEEDQQVINELIQKIQDSSSQIEYPMDPDREAYINGFIDSLKRQSENLPDVVGARFAYDRRNNQIIGTIQYDISKYLEEYDKNHEGES